MNVEELKKQAAQGSADACFELAETYYARKNYEEAFRWYIKTVSCKKPNPVAYFNIAYAYQYGEGTELDMISAFDYYEKAAALGLPQALYNLAFFYQNGIIAPRDERKAFRLCREANIKLGELEGRTRELERKNEELNENYAEAIRFMDKLDDRAKSCENKIDKLADRNRVLIDELNTTRLSEGKEKERSNLLEKQLRTSADEIRKLNEELKTSEKFVNNKDMLISHMNEEMKKTTQKYSELAQDLARERREKDILKTDYERLMTERAGLNEKINGLNRLCAEKDSIYSALRQKNQALDMDIARVSATVRKLILTAGILGGALALAIVGFITLILL